MKRRSFIGALIGLLGWVFTVLAGGKGEKPPTNAAKGWSKADADRFTKIYYDVSNWPDARTALLLGWPVYSSMSVIKEQQRLFLATADQSADVLQREMKERDQMRLAPQRENPSTGP